MNIPVSLFSGDTICLGPIQPDADAEIEAGWTQDAAFMRMMNTTPMLPLTPAQIKKKYEAIEKDIDEGHKLAYFAIRARADDRLIGMAILDEINWLHRTAAVRLGIGAASDRRQGFGRQALQLLLRYAFSELNLYCLQAVLPEYNLPALHLFHQAGFVDEVCRRQALGRDGRRWDVLHLGLLQEEWAAGIAA